MIYKKRKINKKEGKMKTLIVTLFLAAAVYTASAGNNSRTQFGIGFKVIQEPGADKYSNMVFQISGLWPDAGVFADISASVMSRWRIIIAPSITVGTVGLQYAVINVQDARGLVVAGYGATFGRSDQEKLYHGWWYGVRFISPALSDKFSDNLALTIQWWPADAEVGKNAYHTKLFNFSLTYNI